MRIHQNRHDTDSIPSVQELRKRAVALRQQWDPETLRLRRAIAQIRQARLLDASHIRY